MKSRRDRVRDFYKGIETSDKLDLLNLLDHLPEHLRCHYDKDSGWSCYVWGDSLTQVEVFLAQCSQAFRK